MTDVQIAQTRLTALELARQELIDQYASGVNKDYPTPELIIERAQKYVDFMRSP